MLGLWNAPVAQLFLRRDARATPSAAFALGGWAGAPATTQHRYRTPTSAAWHSLDLTHLEATTHSLLRIWPALARVRQNVMYCIGSQTDQGQQSNQHVQTALRNCSS